MSGLLSPHLHVREAARRDPVPPARHPAEHGDAGLRAHQRHALGHRQRPQDVHRRPLHQC